MHFLIRWCKSSGMAGAKFLVFKMRRILEPVMERTCGVPKLSRRVTPIWEGVRPFLASLQMCSETSSGFILSQVGARRRYGSAELLIPFPLPYIRPILLCRDFCAENLPL